MTKASDNAFPSLLITEGTEPSAPAAGKQRLYIDSTTHHLMRTNSSGTETDIESGGGGIPATILDAKGDLIAASAADTAAKLTAGANGSFLQTLSSETTGLIWRAAPAAASVLLTSANYTGTASTTWGDVTGATHTITTLARRVRVHVVGCAQGATAGDSVAFDIAVDGTRVSGSTNGLTAIRISNASYRQNFSFTYLTDVLSAASHTIKLQSNRIVGSGTITIFAVSSDSALAFAVEETFLTT